MVYACISREASQILPEAEAWYKLIPSPQIIWNVLEATRFYYHTNLQVGSGSLGTLGEIK